MLLFLLPDADDDPTESSVPWQALRWPGDCYRFANDWVDMVKQARSKTGATDAAGPDFLLSSGN